MKRENLPRYRTASFVLVLFWLLLLAAGLGVLMFALLSNVDESDPDARLFRVRLAWVCLALLGGVVVLLAWAIMRFVRQRTLPARPRKPTPHVDDWAEAGKRFQLPDKDAEQDDGEAPEGNGDAQGPPTSEGPK